MRRFIVTGTPGAGKSVIIRQLERDGFTVVEEAATDLIALEQARGIAEPWTDPSFIDAVANLQKQGRRAHPATEECSFTIVPRSARRRSPAILDIRCRRRFLGN